MMFFEPLIELFVAAEKAFQRLADDVLVRSTSEEGCITLKHYVRFLVEAGRDDFLFLLGFYLRNQGHILLSCS
jgi:hypothetical protein